MVLGLHPRPCIAEVRRFLWGLGYHSKSAEPAGIVIKGIFNPEAFNPEAPKPLNP